MQKLTVIGHLADGSPKEICLIVRELRFGVKAHVREADTVKASERQGIDREAEMAVSPGDNESS